MVEPAPPREPEPVTRFEPEPGDVVSLSDGGQAIVGAMIGCGGEGSVHHVLRTDGDRRALKWYHRERSDEDRAQLALLIDRGAPAANFLWPEALAEPAAPLGGFGYVMPLAPEPFRSLHDHVKGRVNASFRATLTIGLQVAEAFMRLHNEGLCYRDISLGNVLFHPATGDVLVCDNDNVGVEGVSTARIRGTPYFIAPEVMRGHALPSRNSDLFSLAVLLFYVLMIGHPLLGRLELEHDDLTGALDVLLAGDPLFVFDPTDERNRPDPVEHAAVVLFWSMYPSSVIDKFCRAFTTGLSDPQDGRVRDGEWRMELARARDLIVPCVACGRSSILDLTAREQRCWGARAGALDGATTACDALLVRPPLLRFRHWTVAATAGARLFDHHIELGYDFTRPIATVVQHPTLDLWGLRNETHSTWTIREHGGDEAAVEPGRSASIVAGAEIDIVVDHAMATCVVE